MAAADKPKTDARKGRPLKVFQTRLGFYDIVVAAPSKAAALRAWGTHRDLFADKEAAEARDEKAIAAAQAQPGIALRRAVGTDDPFRLAAGLPRIADLAPARSDKHVKPKPAPPDRSALTAAEDALRTVLERRREEKQDLARRRASLDAEDAEAKGRHAANRSAAEAEVQRQRRAYAKAGGKARD